MEFEVLKGTKDYESKDMIKINKVLDVLRETFESFGFRPFDTPLIEYFETLANKYDEDAEIVQEIFKLSDRGERNLGLRYDLTVPLCRYIASKKQLKLPFRRYAIGKVFRDGPIKKGRVREFIQCDGDVVGVSGREIDAELLDMFYSGYRKLGIDAVVEVNNNKILRGAFLQEGFDEKDLSSLILSVDKLKKIGEDGVLKEIEEKGFDIQKSKNAIGILALNDFKKIRKVAKNKVLVEGIDELEKLVSLIVSLGVENRVNFSMSRGLDIYTGNIWEAYDKNEKITSSIGSGGRYDKAIGNYIGDGKDFPAVGVSFGLVPIIECLTDLDEKEGITEILVVPMDEDLVYESLKIAQKLRKKGNKVEISYDFKLKKAFSYCDYLGVEKILVVGKKDLEVGEFILKDLKTKKEEKIKF